MGSLCSHSPKTYGPDQAPSRPPRCSIPPVNQGGEACLLLLALGLDPKDLSRSVRRCRACRASPQLHLQRARKRHRGGTRSSGEEPLTEGCRHISELHSISFVYRRCCFQHTLL